MEFNTNSTKVNSRYLYNTDEPKTAEPTIIYNVETDTITGQNDKPYLVGLSGKRNTPIRSEASLIMFHSEAIEVEGTTHYFYTK